MTSSSHRYEVLQRLGRGGFGDVYRARVVGDSDGTDLAIKLLRPSEAADRQELERLNDEARYLSLVEHPSVVRVLGMVDFDGQPGLVTAYVRGRDLRRVLSKIGPLPTRCAVEMLARVAEALHAAAVATTPDGEPLRLTHRDVKPANIMLGPAGEVVLLDFGIARTDIGSREAHTARGQMLGTGSYTAPETIWNEAPTSEGDVWSLALTAYEAMTGGQLFEKLDMAALVKLIQYGEPRQEVLLKLKALGLSPELNELMADMTELDPEDRPSPEQAAARARAILADLPGQTLAEWAAEQPWPPIKMRPSPLDGRIFESELLPVPPWPAPGERPIEEPLLTPPELSAAGSPTSLFENLDDELGLDGHLLESGGFESSSEAGVLDQESLLPDTAQDEPEAEAEAEAEAEVEAEAEAAGNVAANTQGETEDQDEASPAPAPPVAAEAAPPQGAQGPVTVEREPEPLIAWTRPQQVLLGIAVLLALLVLGYGAMGPPAPPPSPTPGLADVGIRPEPAAAEPANIGGPDDTELELPPEDAEAAEGAQDGELLATGAHTPRPRARTPQGADGSPSAEVGLATEPAPGPRAAPAEPAPKAGADEETRTRKVNLTASRRVLVTLNGEALGYTPMKVDLPLGSHTLTTMLPGHPESKATRQLKVSASPLPLRVNLDQE